MYVAVVGLEMASEAGFEPATAALTVRCSTAELPGIKNIILLSRWFEAPSPRQGARTRENHWTTALMRLALQWPEDMGFVERTP